MTPTRSATGLPLIAFTPPIILGLDTINRTRRISRPPRDSLWLSPAHGLAPRTTTVRLIVAPRDWHVSGTMQMGIHFPPLCLHPCLFVMLHVTGKMYSGSRTSREAVAVQFFGGPVAVIIVLYIPPHALLTRSGNHAASASIFSPPSKRFASLYAWPAWVYHQSQQVTIHPRIQHGLFDINC